MHLVVTERVTQQMKKRTLNLKRAVLQVFDKDIIIYGNPVEAPFPIDLPYYYWTHLYSDIEVQYWPEKPEIAVRIEARMPTHIGETLGTVDSAIRRMFYFKGKGYRINVTKDDSENHVFDFRRTPTTQQDLVAICRDVRDLIDFEHCKFEEDYQ